MDVQMQHVWQAQQNKKSKWEIISVSTIAELFIGKVKNERKSAEFLLLEKYLTFPIITLKQLYGYCSEIYKPIG